MGVCSGSWFCVPDSRPLFAAILLPCEYVGCMCTVCPLLVPISSPGLSEDMVRGELCVWLERDSWTGRPFLPPAPFAVVNRTYPLIWLLKSLIVVGPNAAVVALFTTMTVLISVGCPTVVVAGFVVPPFPTAYHLRSVLLLRKGCPPARFQKSRRGFGVCRISAVV